MNDPACILLHPNDNCMVAARSLSPGETVLIDGAETRLTEVISAGHKLARYDIPAGGKIAKYGAPIGSATQDISRGGHIHGHNMKSDYIPSHAREDIGGQS